ncbi:MAG TPA: hypothetical protein VGS19_21305 [Streptosporangiaceae bacterium]|nr:hypothetical protein [Streptosporangiaceae bacterium]
MQMRQKNWAASNLPAGFLAVASAALTVLAVIATAPASAESIPCASSINQQGSECASFTFYAGSSEVAVTTAKSQAAGSPVGVSKFVFGNASPPAPDQDLDTLSVNSDGVPNQSGPYTELEIMPYGVEGTLCLKATTMSATASFVLARCGSSRLEQFTTSHETSQGFEWRLRGSGSPGLAITQEGRSGLGLKTWTGAPDQYMQRTD